MNRNTRWFVGLFLSVFMGVCTSADQAPQLSKVMRAKLGHSQAILAAVITSDWALLERESRALALAVRDPAWGAALTEPEYLRQSDAFARALQDLIEVSARRDLEAAGNACDATSTSAGTGSRSRRVLRPGSVAAIPANAA
jgi:hypothetical protein